jgi:oxygen-independent coproporphyrinogen-3 oxidase
LTDASPGAAPPIGVPIGVYVHWPYCARICPYCDFNVVRDRGKTDEAAALAGAIIADIEAQARTIGPRRLTTIFFGGGTPSLMDPAHAAAIIDAARRAFEPDPDLEITLEANPTDAESGRFQAFADLGVQRLSLGVQSLDDHALAFLGRNHDGASARRAAEAARRSFPRLSLDLIYGLPGQDVAAWRAQLEAALALGPEHISAYQLTIEPGTPFDRAVQRRRWSPPEADLAAALYETTNETLSRAGFDAYEVSNHARGEAARSRHNLIYWRGGEWLGVGPGAHGRLNDAEGRRWSTVTPARIADYIAGPIDREPLTPRDVGLERLMMGLRIREGVAVADLAPLDIDPAALDALAEAGLIEHPTGRLTATESGRAVLDRIILELAQASRSV